MTLLLLVAFPLFFSHPDSPSTMPERSERLRQHLFVIAHDSMQGRAIGSTGESRSATYIESQFQGIGLRPPYPASSYPQPSYRQNFLLHSGFPSTRSTCSLWLNESIISLALWNDYFPFTTGSQTFLGQPVRLVFVGYGITAPEFKYDDYRGMNVENAVVVFLSGEPASESERFFDGRRSTVYSNQNVKQETALAHGARGCIMIDCTEADDPALWETIVREYKTDIVTPMEQHVTTFSIAVSHSMASLLFDGSSHTFADILRLREESSMKSFPLSSSISFEGKFEERDFRSQNIIGILDGTDSTLCDTCIIVSAHYDHLGIRVPVDGDSLYNGAFDNAAGVAALIDIAAHMKASNYHPKRTIVFACLTGEEKGFLGSLAYIDAPPFPLKATACALNIDGLAMFDSLLDVVVLGDAYSTIGDLLDPTLAQCGLTRVPVPENITQDAPFFNSDQCAFAQAGIPSALITEGIRHRSVESDESLRKLVEWTRSRYHQPSDDLHQPMNLKAAAYHVDVLEQCIRALADSPVQPHWMPVRNYFNKN